MPFAFDLGRYSTDFNPLAGGTFVNIGDVMNAYGDVFQEVIALLPKLLQMLEELSTQDIIQLLEVGLDAFLQLLFPLDGSLSPLIKALIDVLTNAATSGQLWTQMINLAIQLGPQIFMAMENVITGGTAADLLAAFITLFATVLTSNTALLQGFGAATPILEQLISAGGGTGNTLADFGSLLGAATSIAITGITGLAAGIEPWLAAGGPLPTATTLGLSQLSGLASGIEAWLATGGSLPAATTLGASQLTSLATGIGAWLTLGGSLPAASSMTISQIIGLAGYLTNMDVSGVLSLAGLGSGALPSGITTGASQLTGLATGVLPWLTAGGALPGATTLGAGQLSGLATGIASWLSGGGALPGATTLGGSQIVGTLDITAISVINALLGAGVAGVDPLVRAWGGTSTGYTQTDLANFATSIGNQFVQGLLGGATVGATIQNQADAIVQGIYNSSSYTNTSLGTVTGALNAFANLLGFNLSGVYPADSVAGQSQDNNLFISKMPVTKPITSGIDRSAYGPFDIAYAIAIANGNGGTLPLITCNLPYTYICAIPTVHGGVIKSLRFYGYGTAPIWEFYIRIWKLNTTNATSQMIYATPNLAGVISMGAAPVWNVYNIQRAAGFITCAQDEVLLAEVAFRDDGSGTGKFTMLGMNHEVNNVTSAIPQHMGMYGQPPPKLIADQGGGYTTGATTEKTKTLSITPYAWQNAILVGVNVYGIAAMTNITATFGGVAMTKLYQSANLSPFGDFAYNVVFGLIGTAGTGPFAGTAKNLVVTATGLGTSAGLAIGWGTYAGVTSFGTPQTASGTGTTANQTVTGVSPYIFQLIFAGDNFTDDGDEELYTSVSTTMTYPALVQTEYGYEGSTYMWASLASSQPWSAVAIPVNAGPKTMQDPGLGANPYYNTGAPWIGLAATPGVSDTSVYAPVTVPIYASQTMTNPTLQWPWANNFDIVLCGAGAGGDAGYGYTGSWGGADGAWTGATLSKAQMGTSDITWGIGVGGNGGGTMGAGGNTGGSSACTVPGWGTVSTPGGTGRGSALATSGNLAGAGVSEPGYAYNGDTFPGSSAGQTGQQGGQQPGSGGAGGNAFFSYGQNTYGGKGGDGIGWLVAYQ